MDGKEVLDLKADMEEEWSAGQALMDEQLSFYDLTYPVRLHSKDLEPYRPPTGPSRVDSACDHILVGNEVITVPPRRTTRGGTTQEAQTQADRLERFYQALTQRVDKTLSEPVLRQLAKLALIFGFGVLKGPLWDASIADKPARDKGERKTDYEGRIKKWENIRRHRLPLKFHAVDPRQVYFPAGQYPIPFLIEVNTRTAGYVEDTYGISLGARDRKQEVEWVEYWDDKQRLYLANGVEVLPKTGRDNLGGFIPYSIVFSGFGRVPTYRTRGRFQATETLCRGLLYPVLGALEEEAILLSAVHSYIMTHSYPIQLLPEAFVTRIQKEPGLGGAMVVPEGAKVEFLANPPMLPDVYRVLVRLRQEIDDATFSGVLTGQAPPGIEAGYPLAILIGQARMKFGALIGNLERCREESFGNVGRLVEALDESVTVFANLPKGAREETLRGEDWNGHYELYCKLSAVSPEEADRRIQLGYTLWKGRGPDEPGISHRTLLEEYAMRPDYTEEQARIRIERGLVSPSMKEALDQFAVKEWAGIEIKEALEEAEKKKQAPPVEGGIGGAGVPPGPAAPGSPEELSTFAKRLQRLGGVAAQAEPIGGPREEVR